MLHLTCPICGLDADESAFVAGGEAHLDRIAPEAATGEGGAEALRDYLYMRRDSPGIQHELWLCRFGCGKWFHAARDTHAQEFLAFYRIDEPKPQLTAGRKPRV